MKIFITGVAGFIGFHLTKACLKKGYSVLGLDNLNDYYDKNLKLARLIEIKKSSGYENFEFFQADLEDRNQLKNIFKTRNIKKVIHLAAQAGVRYSINNPYPYFQSNLVGFGNILECCRDANIENFIFASSSSVYGLNDNAPFSEEYNVDHPISLYAATKKSNELMAHSYCHLYGIPTIGLRFFTVYGPWGRPDMALYLFTKLILEGREIEVYGGGELKRDFTYIDDVVKSLLLLINKPACPDEKFLNSNPNPGSSKAPYKIFNIGNSQPVTVNSLINYLEKALGIKARKKFLDIQPGDVNLTSSNCKALEDWIEYKPDTPLEEGVRKFVAWYRNYFRL